MVANGTNARSRAHRARRLGWAPRYDVEALWASLLPEAEAILDAASMPSPRLSLVRRSLSSVLARLQRSVRASSGIAKVAA